MAKFLSCPECGSRVSSKAKSCPHCGVRLKKRGGCLTWIIGFFAFILIVGSCSGGDTDTTKEIPVETTDAFVEQIIDTTASETSLPEITEQTYFTTEETFNVETKPSTLDVDTIATLLESFVAEYFENYNFEYDESSITIDVWQDGIAAGAMLASSGNKEMYASWEDLVDSIEYMSSETKSLMETFGRSDIWLIVNLKNDQNTENTLLSLMNGVVIYDAVIGYNALGNTG